MSEIDEALRRNDAFRKAFADAHLQRPPALGLAIVACMDARVEPLSCLGLAVGDAHVIRNAGGSIADAEIYALAISQRELGTEEVMVIQHTDCGLLGFEDADFVEALERETGSRPGWESRGFSDLEQSVRDSLLRIRDSPFIPKRDRVRGFVYDVATGGLGEVV